MLDHLWNNGEGLTNWYEDFVKKTWKEIDNKKTIKLKHEDGFILFCVSIKGAAYTTLQITHHIDLDSEMWLSVIQR